MTLRERLADWISGGALTMWQNNWSHEADDKLYWIELAASRREALRDIANATRDGKSGTARKVHRMATEALK